MLKNITIKSLSDEEHGPHVAVTICVDGGQIMLIFRALSAATVGNLISQAMPAALKGEDYERTVHFNDDGTIKS